MTRTANGVVSRPCPQGGAADGGELAGVLASEVGVCVRDQSPLSHRAVRALLGLRFTQDSEGTCPQWRIACITASIAAAYTLGEYVGPSPRPLPVLTGAEKCVVPFSVSAQLHGQTPPIHVVGMTQHCRGPHPWLPASIPSHVPACIILWSSVWCKCAPFLFLLSSSFVFLTAFAPAGH